MAEQPQEQPPVEDEVLDPAQAAPPADAPEAAAGAEAGAEAPAEPDYKDLYLRAAAESDNVRKRARRDVEAAQARGIGRLAKELLPALDNLERALDAAEASEGGDELTRGIRLVQQELLSAMGRLTASDLGLPVEVKSAVNYTQAVEDVWQELRTIAE